MRYPNPACEIRNSPMMTPTQESPTFTFRVEKRVGALAGNTSSHRICQRLAPRERMRRIFSPSVERNP